MCCLVNTIYSVTDWIFYVIMAFVGIMIVIGAFTIITAGGNPENVTKGRNYILYAIIGMVVAFFACVVSIFIPYKVWKKFSLIIFVTAFFLLLFVLFSSFGAQFGTFAKSWINLPGLPAFQPSEFAKIAIILYLASWMSRRSEQIQTFKEGLIPFAILTSIIVIPIIRQPDYGSALIIAIIAASIFFLAGKYPCN